MTKKDLIKALENVKEDAVIMFGNDEFQFFGSFATQVYINSGDGNNKILITNYHTDKTTPEYCELLHEDN